LGNATACALCGKTACFDITPFSYAYTILDNGLLSSAEATASVDALCVLTPLLLVRLGLHDENAHNEIHSEGDDALLTEIFSFRATYAGTLPKT